MASMSKRTQARNERELHDLLRLPGNGECADCGARNPAWASWSLGIFLCMRCASLHRKLGTHLSKVKSLSMDTWTSEQVENMKRHGNTAVNKVYNPRNRKPDVPLDADEVDSAMERFIRKKYQEKTLSQGKPEPPRRDDAPPPRRTYSGAEPSDSPPPPSPPPPLPPKKGKFFGFGLRASSGHAVSKHDKKKASREPRIDAAFPISTDDYNSMSRMSDVRFDMTDAELQRKLASLRDMGFPDDERNTTLLRRLGGNVERTVETLVRLGPSDKAATTAAARKPDQPPATQSFKDKPMPVPPRDAPSEPSYNPFTQVTNQPTVGISLTTPQDAPPSTTQPYSSNNPFGQAVRSQTDTGLEQSMHAMQLNQPLFPHSTGGYPSQIAPPHALRTQSSMTPPVPYSPYQQGYVASPAAVQVNTNPFFQPPAQATGSNPFLPQAPPAVSSPSSVATNPFLTMPGHPSAQTPQRQYSLPANINPFGLPPSQSPPQFQQQAPAPPAPSHNPFGTDGSGFLPAPPVNASPAHQADQYLQQSSLPQSNQPPFSQPAYVPPAPQAQSFQYPPQFAPQQPFNAQQPGILPQQTGRFDKNSILALYNYPQLAPQPLASIPEPTNEALGSQNISPVPAQQVNPDIMAPNPPPQRSATLPVSLSQMHSAGGSGNRNPFLANTNTASTTANAGYAANPVPPVPYGGLAAASPAKVDGISARHTSRESMNISNLDSGRHSPDAFANLSARYR